MKTRLAIALAALVYAVGFCDNPVHSQPRMAPTVPMAPGVVNPGVKNSGNKDVPHQGDDLMGLYADDTSELLVVPITQQDEDDGSKSIVIVVVNFGGVPGYNSAHRVGAREFFKCAEGKHRHGFGYVLDDEGNIIATQPNQNEWVSVIKGSVAELVADVVCGSRVKHHVGEIET